MNVRRALDGEWDVSPSMPGLLIVEALAQLGGILLLLNEAECATMIVYFASVTNVVWHAAVIPGTNCASR